jgi:regulator of protease activity HflC (stomatin/prohibitin superfamily)
MKTIRTLLLLAFAALLGACTQIDTGNVGVERTLGNVKQDPLPPGIYMTFFKTVDEFTAKEVSFALADMTPKSRDNLTMKDVDLDVYFKVAPAAIPKLYVKYQGDVANDKNGDYVIALNRVQREAREAVYKSIASMDATTMHTKRAELAEAVRTTLQSELDANDKGAFTITVVNVRNLLTDPAIELAIRQRAEMDQTIEKKQKELEFAKAEALRKVVEAEGEAKANHIISQSLTPQLVRLKEIEAQKAFAVQGTHTVLMGGSATPLISVK